MKEGNLTPDDDRENGSEQSEDNSETASQSVDDLLQHREFRDLFKKNCRAAYNRLDLGKYNPAYGPDDHYGDCCEKLLKSRDTLRLKNIPNAKALAAYLYKLALNQGLSKYSEIKRLRPWAFPGHSAEESPEVDSRVNLFRQVAIRELLGFASELPHGHGRALELWLEGHSYREVSRRLAEEGIKVSHVGVQKWVESGRQFLVAKAS